MTGHEFTIVASGLNAEAGDFEDRLFEAGCDDATIALQKGAIILEFNRKAVSFPEAVASACRDVVSAGATVERVEPDHLVSLSDIADRAGLTRQAAALYSVGERGVGFPHPIARVTSKTPLWDWSEVAEWLHAHGRLDQCAVQEARVVRAANLALGHRHALPSDFAARLEQPTA